MDDLISRQAVLELVNNMVETAIIPYRPFQKAVKVLPSVQPEQRWIPVSERLPEEGTDVIICNINGNIEISSGSYHTSTELKNAFFWYTRWGFGEVAAWMPLPEPYTESKE